MILLPQQVEVSCSEAKDLVLEIYKILSRPIDEQNKMELFEAMAYPALKSANLKLTKRILKAKPGSTLTITFSAQELIAMNQLINYYPVELYNILSSIDRKVLNYDSIVEF